MAATFERLTAEIQSGKRVLIDPRCWRSIYHVRLFLQKRIGFLPSYDYALSEILVDPLRGAKMLTQAEREFGKVDCPRQYSPQGNRFRDSVNANEQLTPGGVDDDWGA